MLIGTYEHNMDAKKRVIMPAKFRDDIGNIFCLTIASGRCLRAYSEEEWKKYEAKIAALPESNENALKYKRRILSNSGDCEVDSQGRIIIPAKLCEYASLTKEITIIGQTNYIEIWDTGVWNEYCAKMNSEDLSDIVGSLSEFGI